MSNKRGRYVCAYVVKKKLPIKTTERAEQRKPSISHRLILIYWFHLFPFFFQFQTREKNKKEKRFSCLPVLLIALKLSYIFYMMMMMKWGQICNLIHGLKPALTMVVVQVAFAGVNVFYKLAANNGMSLRVIVAYRFIFATAFMVPVAIILERWFDPVN